MNHCWLLCWKGCHEWMSIMCVWCICWKIYMIWCVLLFTVYSYLSIIDKGKTKVGCIVLCYAWGIGDASSICRVLGGFKKMVPGKFEKESFVFPQYGLNSLGWIRGALVNGPHFFYKITTFTYREIFYFIFSFWFEFSMKFKTFGIDK